LIQYFFGKDLLGIPVSDDGRVVGMFHGNLHLGLFLVVLLPILLWPLAARKPLIVLLLLLLAGIVAGLSGARTNLFFLILIIFGLLLQLPWRYGAGAILAFVLAWQWPNALSPVQHSRLAQFNATAPQKAAPDSTFERIDGILSRRLTIWEAGGRMLLDRPLTGVVRARLPQPMTATRYVPMTRSARVAATKGGFITRTRCMCRLPPKPVSPACWD